MSNGDKNILRAIWKDTSFRLSIILTLIFFGTGTAFLFLGLVGFSWILFILLPFVLGVSIGALPSKKEWIYFGVIFTTIFFLIGLLLMGASGFICILMTLPLVLPLIFFGSIVAHLVKRYKKIKSTRKLQILLLPLVPFLISAPIENFMRHGNKEYVDVKTERIFNYTTDQVYDAIKSVDTLDAEKPWLMSFDLPVPTKCVLEKEEVGGIRTCYFIKGNLSNADFGGGTITEKITRLEKGKILKMDVINYNLIGRKWLGFKEAIYYFDKVGEHRCKMTRITTYTSVLTPRFYWEPMEKLGIRQEHDYVFNNLEKDLKNKYGSHH